MEDRCADHRAHERVLSDHDRRLDSHSGDIRSVREVLAKLTQIEEQNQQRLDAAEHRLSELEARPAKRWGTVETVLVTATVTTMANWALSALPAVAG